ncbi:hypothetical protein BST95_11635 [Halioglobus japonicus]|uniref:Uncharacterized protein n=2 Tax=Halioglobus japonicus TaxID=930805 RepID=A0AAP8MFJ0_9GAMM|nr:hypothetical protein BST95_11635 [Halioglobus japonicus]PLW86825.1 hypothetical protein C0029_10635 [Halioglobus japonicus]
MKLRMLTIDMRRNTLRGRMCAHVRDDRLACLDTLLSPTDMFERARPPYAICDQPLVRRVVMGKGLRNRELGSQVKELTGGQSESVDKVDDLFEKLAELETIDGLRLTQTSENIRALELGITYLWAIIVTGWIVTYMA